MQLIFRGVALKKVGFAGAVVIWSGHVLCIDVPDGDCDVYLYTHNHPRHRPFELPREYISPFGGRVVKPGDVVSLEWARVEVVSAYNISKFIDGRLPHPPGEGVGYVVDVGDVRIYHMGDTDLHNGVLINGVDVLFIPIGGVSVMNPEEAAYAVMSIRPKVTVPIHFEEKRDFVKFRDMAYAYTQVVWLR
ncbi:MAG: MBL fold metallo-hydrolase [Pyrobaculum sp.]